jgi:ribosomal subunit interface protein
MQLPLQITFRNMDPSDAVEANVREKGAKLDEFFDNIMACRVVVEAQHRHHHKGYLYNTRIDITVPGREIVVSRTPDKHHAHEDVYVAVRDAFDAAYRQLEDHARKVRGKVKSHETPPHGTIADLHPDEGYGRIKTSDGRLVYFHRNSILNADFDSLGEGDEVRFDEETGDLGPQASTVRVIGKHHIVG